MAAARDAAGQQASGEVARLRLEAEQLRNQVEELMLLKIELERCVIMMCEGMLGLPTLLCGKCGHDDFPLQEAACGGGGTAAAGAAFSDIGCAK